LSEQFHNTLITFLFIYSLTHSFFNLFVCVSLFTVVVSQFVYCLQAICIAACYPEDWPLLIICPSSMRLVWHDALLNWLPACLVPEGSDKLVVIGNGKVPSELASSAL